jgi:hypothetical protein
MLQKFRHNFWMRVEYGVMLFMSNIDKICGLKLSLELLLTKWDSVASCLLLSFLLTLGLHIWLCRGFRALLKKRH